MSFSNQSILMLRYFSTERNLSATNVAMQMKPISLFQEDTHCRANTSWDGEKLTVLPSGDYEWQSPDLAGGRHLANNSLNSNDSSVAMETSFSGWISLGTDRYSSQNVDPQASVESSSPCLGAASPMCTPMEASTPAGRLRFTVGRCESVTDGEFLDNLEDVFIEEGSNIISDVACNFKRLVEAPILSACPGTMSGIDCSEKENSALFGQNTARRNIFASASCSFVSRSSLDGLPLSPSSSKCQHKGRNGRKLRRLSSATEKHQQQPKQRGTALTKCPSESEAASASTARYLHLLTDADLYNDDGRHNDLIGDFSQLHCLPLIARAKHQDLKTITCHTMARILNHEFDDVIAECIVVDCRYPYEFNGGHIAGARNCYSKDEINKEFILSDAASDSSSDVYDKLIDNKRNIIIFHCEFSSERGPKLLRFLRNLDRDLNADCYPKLRYPEIYLLEGGYREFWEHYGQLCTPIDGYVPMIERNFADELIFYRQASKLYKGTVIERNKSSALTRGRYCRI